MTATIRISRPRPSGWAASRGRIRVRVDGRDQPPFRVGESITVDVKPGRHDVVVGSVTSPTSPVLHVTVEDGDAVDVRVEVAPGPLSERMNYSDGFFRLVSDDPAIGSTGAPTKWAGRGAQYGLRGQTLSLLAFAALFVVPWAARHVLAPLGTAGQVISVVLYVGLLGVVIVQFWRRVRYRPDPRSAAPPGRRP